MRVPALVLVLAAAPAAAAVKNVSTAAELQAAITAAQAGDVIVLADGTYDLGSSPSCAAEGSGAQPITVRAANKHAAHVRFNTLEGFKVSGRSWTFEGLDIEGVCAVDSNCEHAFHVTGHAENFVLRDSKVRNFNAQLKVNAAQNGSGVYEMPHRGLVERNEIYDTRPRNTGTPVTKLNIDTGDDWVVRDNYLHDFSRAGGISYGAFMKSGGKRGVFERNRVLCVKDAAAGDTRIGLSFGGGGTGEQYCAPAFKVGTPCDPEHSDGVIRNNVIANCSDVAIYLNKARNTQVLFNTLIKTTGVDYRYASSTGEAHGNVMTSVVRNRDGAGFTAGTNLTNVADTTWSGWYQAPLAGDLRLKGSVSQLIGAAAPRAAVTDDFCARARPGSGNSTLGALEHSLGDCAAGGAPDAGTSPDAGTGSDAGTPGGGGVTPPGGGGSLPGGDSGGGCSAAPGLAALLALLCVPLLRRRAR